MKKLRNRLLKSKIYFFPIVTVLAFLLTYLSSSFFGRAKPIEQFRIFISGIEFDSKKLSDRLLSYKSEKYDYILVMERIMANEVNSDSYNYDYQFTNEGIQYCDILIYPQSYFESTYANEGYKGHFLEINNPNANWTMLNSYAVKIHDKNDEAKDNTLGITFGNDNYLASINNKTVHYSQASDAAIHFIEAFIND